MRIARSGRFVFVAQWALAVVLPAFFFIGRGLVGAQLGWLFVLGIFSGVFVIVLLLVPPILTLFDRGVRKGKATREVYDIASFTLWGAFLVASLTVPDAGDGPPLDSALTVWTGGAVTQEISAGIFSVAAIVIGLVYLALLVIAVVGIVTSRQSVEA